MDRVKRGDIMIAAPPGDYGKPRPVLIVQDDAFDLASVTVLPFTSDLRDAPCSGFRLNRMRRMACKPFSHLMIDKAITLPRTKIGQRIGHVDPATMRSVNRALAIFFGLTRSIAE